MSQGVQPIAPITPPDLSPLIEMQKTAKKTAFFNIIILFVLIGAFLIGGYTVYNRLIGGTTSQSAITSGVKGQITAPTGPGTTQYVCGDFETSIRCEDGTFACGTPCKPNQTPVCGGPTGARTYTCQCSKGFTGSQFCNGCVPESCPTGTYICPSEGICTCTAEATCDMRINSSNGVIIPSSTMKSVTCPAKCVNATQELQGVNATGYVDKMDELCRTAPCIYNPDDPDSYVECQAENMTFDGYNRFSRKCYKQIECSKRPDPSAVTVYGENTISNLPTSCLSYKTGANGECLPLALSDIKNKCLNDSYGCMYGYSYDETTKMCVNTSGASLPPGEPGCREPGTNPIWDGSMCYGTAPSYNVKSNIIQCQTTWTTLQNGAISSNTQLVAYIGIPKSLLRQLSYQLIAVQVVAFEAFTADTTVGGVSYKRNDIMPNGNKSSWTMYPMDIADPTTIPIPSIPENERSNYYFYMVNAVLGGSDTSVPGLYPSALTSRSGASSTTLYPYRFNFGVILRLNDGKYYLKALSEESRPTTLPNGSSNYASIGLLQYISMNRLDRRGPTSLPMPPIISGEVAKRVFSQNTTDKEKILSIPIYSNLPRTTSNLSQNIANFLVSTPSTPYCISGCTPELCPGIISSTNTNVSITTQIAIFAINIDLSNINVSGASTDSQKESQIYMYILRTPLAAFSSGTSWYTMIQNKSTNNIVVVDNKDPSFVLSNIKSTTDTDGSKYYVIADYVDVTKGYRYDVGYYWGADNYLDALDNGTASSLRTFMVTAPAYDKESCWNIPYSNTAGLPPHMVTGTDSNGGCVSPEFTVNKGYDANAPRDFFKNIYSSPRRTTNTLKFNDIDPKNVVLFNSVQNNLPTYKNVKSLPITTSVSPDPAQKDWTATSDLWFTGATGAYEIRVPDGVGLQDPANPTGAFETMDSQTYRNRLAGMNAFGVANVPGYVPITGSETQYVRGPTGPVKDVGFYLMDDTANRFGQNEYGRLVGAKGYTSANANDMDINNQLVSKLNASNTSNLEQGTKSAYNYISEIINEPVVEGIYKKFSGVFKYFSTPNKKSDGTNNTIYDVSPTTTSANKVTSLAFTQAPTCSNKSLIMCNIGSPNLSASCTCSPAAGDIGKCTGTTTPRNTTINTYI